MKIDFDHTTGQNLAEQAISNADEERELTIIEKLKPEFGKDGNQFFFLLGDLPTGIVGFGSTVAEATSNFCRAFYNEKA